MRARDRADAGLGAVLGALVGDAAGAVLEFFERDIEKADVEHALTMPGGGTWRVAPGQVTDDGELTMCQLRALASSRDAAEACSTAATYYARWAASGPFDIGATTAASLGCLRNPELAALAEKDGAHVVITRTAQSRCMASKANGSLMRSTPLGVWGARHTSELVRQAAAADARLSHPNPSCVGATVAYVSAIRHLVVELGDVAGALSAAERALEDPELGEPRAWLADAKAGVLVPYTPMDGFVRIAFTHAFRHLIHGTSYEDALAETLAGGGDTDTNACIVGGLLGARSGAEAIPARWRDAVLGCTTASGANPRPDELHPRAVPELVRAILGATG